MISTRKHPPGEKLLASSPARSGVGRLVARSAGFRVAHVAASGSGSIIGCCGTRPDRLSDCWACSVNKILDWQRGTVVRRVEGRLRGFEHFDRAEALEWTVDEEHLDRDIGLDGALGRETRAPCAA